MNRTEKSQANTPVHVVQCQCGKVSLEVTGAPIMTVACYCQSCQKAASVLQALEGAPAMLDAQGGTHFIMQRMDRQKCVTGKEQLREYRLTPEAGTRRVIASCCNTSMFLDFSDGHWLSIYKDRLDPAQQPPLQMRTMTQGKRADVVFADDIPSPGKHTVGFMWKLLSAWIAMGFKNPKIDYVRGTIDG